MLLHQIGRYVSHSERMDSIYFVGQRSKIKFTIDMYMYGNKLVNTIETSSKRCVPLHWTWQACLPWWEDELNWFWMLQVKGEGHHDNVHHWQMWGARGCYALHCYILIWCNLYHIINKTKSSWFVHVKPPDRNGSLWTMYPISPMHLLSHAWCKCTSLDL